MFGLAWDFDQDNMGLLRKLMAEELMNENVM